MWGGVERGWGLVCGVGWRGGGGEWGELDGGGGGGGVGLVCGVIIACSWDDFLTIRDGYVSCCHLQLKFRFRLKAMHLLEPTICFQK